jgi:cation transporter-like permease
MHICTVDRGDPTSFGFFPLISRQLHLPAGAADLVAPHLMHPPVAMEEVSTKDPVALFEASSANSSSNLLQRPLRPASPIEGAGTDYISRDIPWARSVFNEFRARFFWLALFLVGLWGAAFVVNRFEHMLQHNVELAHFVPLIIGHGGNAGSQAVSSVIRALAAREITVARDGRRVVVHEVSVGLAVGLALGAVVVGVSHLTRLVSPEVGAVVAISLPLVTVWANCIGAVLPLAAQYIGASPALTSAPLMTTIIDSSGLLIYFLVAQIVFAQTEFHPDFHHDVSRTHVALGLSGHHVHEHEASGAHGHGGAAGPVHGSPYRHGAGPGGAGEHTLQL